MTLGTLRVAGDETTGFFTPAAAKRSDWPRLDPKLLAKLAVPGLTPTASDVMDELGLPLVTSAEVLRPRLHGARIAGQAVTLRYLPERRLATAPSTTDPESRLANRSVLAMCTAGDVLVIDAVGQSPSTLGGMGALSISRAGLAGVVVDGAVRDVDEIEAVGLPVWSRAVTPQTGKFRLEAVEINGPVSCGGHQVIPGDLVLADASGVCFIPVELAERAIEAILEVALRELDELQSTPDGSS